MVIEIRDDGRGIDKARVRNIAERAEDYRGSAALSAATKADYFSV